MRPTARRFPCTPPASSMRKKISGMCSWTSPATGEPVYIRDFAEVERRYQDPQFVVRYDGEPCLLLSVEMQKGKNIVELGVRIQEVFTRLKSLLPPDIRIDLIANQPEVVKERITHLGHEFMLAIASVVLVTIILLPIRVAVIAALAIPITLCITLGAMNAHRNRAASGLYRCAHCGPRDRRGRCDCHCRQLCRSSRPQGPEGGGRLALRFRSHRSGPCRNGDHHLFFPAPGDTYGIVRRVYLCASDNGRHSPGRVVHCGHLHHTDFLQILYQERAP